MRFLTILTLSTIFLILTSCQKEEIQPTTPTKVTPPDVTQQNPPNSQDATVSIVNTTTDSDSIITNTTNEFSVLEFIENEEDFSLFYEALTRTCLLYTSPSPRDATLSRMPSSA